MTDYATNRPLGQAGYVIQGSGGGGEGGTYVFADLDELDNIITKLEALAQEIRQDGRGLLRAAELANPPAEDHMSTGQASAYAASLNKARAHNEAMVSYAEHQLVKLRAARTTYVETDAESAARLRTIDEAGR